MTLFAYHILKSITYAYLECLTNELIMIAKTLNIRMHY
jgi:hypothetical protein